jgi:hypothetical protein
MSRRRQHRYHPGGKGWIRVIDYGYCVGWLRPNPDGPGVQAVLYGPARWIGREPQESPNWLVYEVTEVAWPWYVVDELFNKPGRFHWLTTERWEDPLYDDWTPKSPERFKITWSVRTMRPNHRGHRRLNPHRRTYLGRTQSVPEDTWGWMRGKRMPRKLRLALYGEH